MGESTRKTCTKCGESKPLDAYYVRKGKPQAQCKACIIARNKAWNDAHPEVTKAAYTRYQRKNKDKVRAHNVAWYHANKERSRKRAVEWRRKNPERHRAMMAAWRARPENNERLRAISRKYRADNLDKIKARLAANPEKGRLDANRRRARLLAATIGPIDLELLWVRQCALCSLCGERIDRSIAHPDPMSRSVDHTVPLSRGGAHEQSNLTWTHLICNLQKGTQLPS